MRTVKYSKIDSYYFFCIQRRHIKGNHKVVVLENTTLIILHSSLNFLKEIAQVSFVETLFGMELENLSLDEQRGIPSRPDTHSPAGAFLAAGKLFQMKGPRFAAQLLICSGTKMRSRARRPAFCNS